jgi:hypothetical protein
MVKTCSRCKRSLAPDFFTRNRARHDGLSWHCRSCKAEQAREWRAKHPDSIAATNRRYERKQQEAARATDALVAALSGSVTIPEWRGEVRRIIVK